MRQKVHRVIPLVQDFAQPLPNPVGRRYPADARRPDGQSPLSGAGFKQELDQKDSRSSVQTPSVNATNQTVQVGDSPSGRPLGKAGAESAKDGIEKDHAADDPSVLVAAQISANVTDPGPGAPVPIAMELPIVATGSRVNDPPAAGRSEGGRPARGAGLTGISPNGAGPTGDVQSEAQTAVAPVDAGPEGMVPKAASLPGSGSAIVVTEGKAAVPPVSQAAATPQPPSQPFTGPVVPSPPTKHEDARRNRAEVSDVPAPARAGAHMTGGTSVQQAATLQPPPADPTQNVARKRPDLADSGALSMLDPDHVPDHRGMQREGTSAGPVAVHPFSVSAGSASVAGLTTGLAPALSRQIVAALARSPDGTVDLTLSPEELGRVRLSLSSTDAGGIIVHVSADRAETMDMIRRHIDTLAQDFRSIGYGSVAFGFSDSNDRGSGGQDNVPASHYEAVPAAMPVPEIVLTSHGSTGLDLRL